MEGFTDVGKIGLGLEPSTSLFYLGTRDIVFSTSMPMVKMCSLSWGCIHWRRWKTSSSSVKSSTPIASPRN